MTNFRLSDVSSNENGTMTDAGSSTVSMPEGPIVNVSTTVKVSGEVVSTIPDPSTLDGHFGETPTYAAISIGHENDHRGPAYFTFQGPTGGPFKSIRGNTINSVLSIFNF
jgi:hypothetical protein